MVFTSTFYPISHIFDFTPVRKLLKASKPSNLLLWVQVERALKLLLEIERGSVTFSANSVLRLEVMPHWQQQTEVTRDLWSIHASIVIPMQALPMLQSIKTVPISSQATPHGRVWICWTEKKLKGASLLTSKVEDTVLSKVEGINFQKYVEVLTGLNSKVEVLIPSHCHFPLSPRKVAPFAPPSGRFVN